ncbi:hypothetical protein BDZ89DRAFT_96142 [Hymenopellis radicata]|nr:hypothetical protein BDZ89DRAFT_96142 [Hymenopellis radicata]
MATTGEAHVVVSDGGAADRDRTAYFSDHHHDDHTLSNAARASSHRQRRPCAVKHPFFHLGFHLGILRRRRLGRLSGAFSFFLLLWSRDLTIGVLFIIMLSSFTYFPLAIASESV